MQKKENLGSGRSIFLVLWYVRNANIFLNQPLATCPSAVTLSPELPPAVVPTETYIASSPIPNWLPVSQIIVLYPNIAPSIVLCVLISLILSKRILLPSPGMIKC